MAERVFSGLFARYGALAPLRADITALYEALVKCFEAGNRLYICGNGGSAADCLHIVGELMKSFVLPRPLDAITRQRLNSLYPGDDFSLLQRGLPAYALVENSSLATAFANDESPDMVFAQQVYGYGRKGDALLCISTSGNAQNAVYAAKVANAIGMTTLALTGGSGGALKAVCDHSIVVPEAETYKIQELHLPVYHAICLALEARFFAGEAE